jgi:hypothetical protein
MVILRGRQFASAMSGHEASFRLIPAMLCLGAVTMRLSTLAVAQASPRQAAISRGWPRQRCAAISSIADRASRSCNGLEKFRASQ